MTDSARVLAEYVRTGSDTAFRDLVTRYIDLVYSTAFRLVDGDAHRAKDVAQTVFLDLSQKAGNISKDMMVGGWLHRHTCFVAAKLIRGERRRQLRERRAAEMNALNATETRFADIAPVLDEAINQLADEDRKAILLRFYEQYDLRSVGEALGSSENAAQKRVARALDQLHSMLRRRGIALSAAALGTALAGEAVTAAPAGLGASIVGTVLAGTAGTGTMVTLAKALAMTKAKLALFGAVLLGAVVTPLVVEHQAPVRLQAVNESLRQQRNELDQLSNENERLSNLVAQASGGQSLGEEQMRELLRLRGEVGRLRQDNKEMDRLRDEIRQLHAAQTQPTLRAGTLTPSGTGQPLSLYTRVIKVNAEPLLSRISKTSTAADGDSNQDVLRQEALRQFFKDLSVDIEPPAAVYLDKTNGTLMVRTSLENLDKIEAILSTLGLRDQKTSGEDAGVFQPGEPTSK